MELKAARRGRHHALDAERLQPSLSGNNEFTHSKRFALLQTSGSDRLRCCPSLCSDGTEHTPVHCAEPAALQSKAVASASRCPWYPRPGTEPHPERCALRLPDAAAGECRVGRRHAPPDPGRLWRRWARGAMPAAAARDGAHPTTGWCRGWLWLPRRGLLLPTVASTLAILPPLPWPQAAAPGTGCPANDSGRGQRRRYCKSRRHDQPLLHPSASRLAVCTVARSWQRCSCQALSPSHLPAPEANSLASLRPRGLHATAQKSIIAHSN